MAAYIATHYRENLRMADVAREVGLHENYAMQLFRRSCGVTLLQHVTQHRIWHAQRLLMTTDLQMVEIAHNVGFGSDSRFYAIFKRVCGITPRRFSQIKGNRYDAMNMHLDEGALKPKG